MNTGLRCGRGGMIREKPGFTLVEMLVVIGIIGLLSAMLLPALRNAKARGNGAVCINNLKQLQLSWQMYADDHNNLPPLNLHMNWMEQHTKGLNWVEGVMAYETTQYSTFRYPIDLTDSTNTTLMMDKSCSILASYTKNPSVYKCPGDRSWIILGGRKHDRVRSYSNYSDFGIGKSVRKSGRPVFVEEHEDSINDGLFEQPQVDDAWTSWRAVPTARHASKGGISFVDGHVELHRWMDPRTLIPVKRLFYLVAEQSLNNPDILWLYEQGR